MSDMHIYDASYIERYCKPGRQALTCAYLMRGPEGWACAKRDHHFAQIIRLRIFEGTLRAQGDNCEGWADPTELAEKFS